MGGCTCGVLVMNGRFIGKVRKQWTKKITNFDQYPNLVWWKWCTLKDHHGGFEVGKSLEKICRRDSGGKATAEKEGIVARLCLLGSRVKYDIPELCPRAKPLDFWHLVELSCMLVIPALKILAYVTPCEFDDKIAKFLTPLLDAAYFIVIIWGSFLVFGKFLEFWLLEVFKSFC